MRDLQSLREDSICTRYLQGPLSGPYRCVREFCQRDYALTPRSKLPFALELTQYSVKLQGSSWYNTAWRLAMLPDLSLRTWLIQWTAAAFSFCHVSFMNLRNHNFLTLAKMNGVPVGWCFYRCWDSRLVDQVRKRSSFHLTDMHYTMKLATNS